MSPSGRTIVAITAAALGTAAAGGAAIAQRRKVRARREVGRVSGDFGSLRADPLSLTASDGVRLLAEIDEVVDPDVDADGLTLVFAHGYALNLDCWHFLRAHFRGRRRMVFYDQRSHGRSDRSTKEMATIDQLGEDLLCVLDQLAPEQRVVLIGHSMGGMTIMALAEHHPEIFGQRVVGVALVSTTAGGIRPHRMISPFLPDRVMSQITPRVMAGLAHAPGLVDGARKAGSDIGFLVTGQLAFGGEVPDSYVEFVDEMLAQTPFDVLAEFFPSFSTLDKFAVLKAFERVPTVIICGDRDRITSIGQSRKMASRLPGARLVECAGAGHMVILERPHEVTSALEQLFAEAAGDGTSPRAS